MRRPSIATSWYLEHENVFFVDGMKPLRSMGQAVDLIAVGLKEL